MSPTNDETKTNTQVVREFTRVLKTSITSMESITCLLRTFSITSNLPCSLGWKASKTSDAR